MNSIANLQQLVNEAIAGQHFPSTPAELYDPVSYMMSLGGKRLRPTLLLLATDLFGGSVLGSMNAALAIELFHNFTLMHDDIMDKAAMRRGFPTVHSRWNENVAILSGDVMLVKAYQLLASLPAQRLQEVLIIFNQTAEDVCRGQQLDMNFEVSDEVTAIEYLEMISLKTAVLLASSLRIGALLGGATPGQAGCLAEFGEHLGIAFQLQDDILDVYGDQLKFGKKPGGDILANKKTWLLIKSREIAAELDKEELNYWLNHPGDDPEGKISAVTDLYTRLGVRALAEEEMNDHAEKALRALEEIEVSKDKKDQLRGFAEQLLVREN